MLVRPEASAAPVAGLDLIHDQQQAMTIAALAQPLHEVAVGGHVTGLALNRLDQHGRGLHRAAIAGEDMVELLETEAGGLLLAPAVAVGIRKRRHHDTAHHRLEPGAQADAGGRGGKRAHGSAVKATVEHDDIRFAGGLTGQSDRPLNRLGAGAGVKDPIDGVRHAGPEPLAELDDRRMTDRGVLAVNERCHLPLRGRYHLGMTMPGAGDADARAEIQIAPVVVAVEIHTFAAHGIDPAGRLQQGGNPPRMAHG